jgi:hypothetical protein
MVRIFVKHKVQDYTAWRKGYDAFEPTRIKLGARGHAVYRDVLAPHASSYSAKIRGASPTLPVPRWRRWSNPLSVTGIGR